MMLDGSRATRLPAAVPPAHRAGRQRRSRRAIPRDLCRPFDHGGRRRAAEPPSDPTPMVPGRGRAVPWRSPGQPRRARRRCGRARRRRSHRRWRRARSTRTNHRRSSGSARRRGEPAAVRPPQSTRPRRPAGRRRRRRWRIAQLGARPPGEPCAGALGARGDPRPRAIERGSASAEPRLEPVGLDGQSEHQLLSREQLLAERIEHVEGRGEGPKKLGRQARRAGRGVACRKAAYHNGARRWALRRRTGRRTVARHRLAFGIVNVLTHSPPANHGGVTVPSPVAPAHP